jgi:hypothetical protein
MTKVTQSISLDLDEIEIINEVKTKYHAKNTSRAISILIKQWQLFVEDRARNRENVKDKPKKPINPLVNP